MTNHRTVSEVYPSPWLQVVDLKEHAVQVTIDQVSVKDLRQMDGSTVPKIVLRFRGKEKALACNKTQALALADLIGTEEFGQWTGATVMLVPGKAPNGKATIAVMASSGVNHAPLG